MKLFFWKTKPADKPTSDRPQSESLIKASFKNDVLGVDEWKRSKVGYLTGASAATKALGTVTASARDARSRLGLLWFSLSSSVNRSVPALEKPEVFKNAGERFEAAVRAQNLKPADLERILRNTKRGGYFYLALSSLFLTLAVGSWFIFPPNGIIDAVGRFGPTPLLLALAFKNTFTNWTVRSRLATTPVEYFKSFSWLPKA